MAERVVGAERFESRVGSFEEASVGSDIVIVGGGSAEMIASSVGLGQGHVVKDEQDRGEADVPLLPKEFGSGRFLAAPGAGGVPSDLHVRLQFGDQCTDRFGATVVFDQPDEVGEFVVREAGGVGEHCVGDGDALVAVGVSDLDFPVAAVVRIVRSDRTECCADFVDAVEVPVGPLLRDVRPWPTGQPRAAPGRGLPRSGPTRPGPAASRPARRSRRRCGAAGGRNGFGLPRTRESGHGVERR